jgi:hypothetical protein
MPPDICAQANEQQSTKTTELIPVITLFISDDLPDLQVVVDWDPTVDW